MPQHAPIQRPRYVDTTWEEAEAHGFDLAQLKYDGHLVRLDVTPGAYHMISRTGKVKESGRLGRFCGRFSLMGELLVGTNWSKCSPLFGRFAAFDIVSIGDEPSPGTYNHRADRLAEYLARFKFSHLAARLFQVETFSPGEWESLWDREVVMEGWEGLVFRDGESLLGADLGRHKMSFEWDYAVTGTIPSESDRHAGRGIQAFRLGLYRDGDLVEVAQVGSMSDELRRDAFLHPDSYIGTVCTIRGKSLFPSGAMRHPSLAGFRDDKRAEDCLFPTPPRTT